MEQHEADWRTIVLSIGAAGGAVIAFGTAVVMLLSAGLDLVRPQESLTGRTAFDFVVLAGAPLAIGAAFLPSLYYSIRRLSGHLVGAANPKVLTLPQGILLILVWAGAAAGAGLLVEKPIVRWITPLLFVLAILIPVYFFARLATGGLRLGSRQRLWGVLTAGIGLGIVPAIFLEILLAMIALVVAIIYLSINPGLLETFQKLATQLRDASNLDQVLRAAGPFLTGPTTLLLGLVFFSGFSPLIEETAKSIATWTVFDRLTSPEQGFAIGAISGAAFGLVESLLVSATPDQNWTTTLLVRGASTMMHIMSASLTGWGIGQFRMTRRPLPMLGMYAAAMGLHGLWNASVVAITVGGIRSATSGGPDIPGVILVGLGVTVLAVLCLAIPISMWGINWQLRKAEASAAMGQKDAAAPALNEGFPAFDQSTMPAENDGAADTGRAAEEPSSPPSGPAA